MDEFEKRLRAARAYAGLSQPAMAEKLGVGIRVLKGIELGTRYMNPVERRGVLEGYAEVTGLPRAWFTADWQQLAHEPAPSVEERLDRIERLLGGRGDGDSPA